MHLLFLTGFVEQLMAPVSSFSLCLACICFSWSTAPCFKIVCLRSQRRLKMSSWYQRLGFTMVYIRSSWWRGALLCVSSVAVVWLLQCFQPIFPKESGEEFWLIQLGLPMKNWQQISPGRTISLPLSDGSTNLVLDHLISDILKGTFGRFNGIAVEGTDTKIFVDVGGSYIIKTIQPLFWWWIWWNPALPCRVHIVHFVIVIEKGCPDHCNSTDSHSGNPAFAEFLGRIIFLRNTGISPTGWRFFGMKEGHCFQIYELGARLSLSVP